jgi:hypothetical protein
MGNFGGHEHGEEGIVGGGTFKIKYKLPPLALI